MFDIRIKQIKKFLTYFNKNCKFFRKYIILLKLTFIDLYWLILADLKSVNLEKKIFFIFYSYLHIWAGGIVGSAKKCWGDPS